MRRLAGDDEAAFVGLRARARRRVDADDDLGEVPRRRFRRHPLALDQRPRPERARRLLDDFGEQFLPADRPALVALGDALEEGARQMTLLSKVEPRVTIVSGSPMSCLMSLVGRGVVVTTICGLSPRRRPSIA